MVNPSDFYDKYTDDINVELCIKLLNKTAHSSARYVAAKYEEGKHFEPATHFAKKTGIDVAGHYEFGDIDNVKAEVLLQTCQIINDFGPLRDIYVRLLEMNPNTLGRLEERHSANNVHVFHGVTSKIAPQDIDFYLGEYTEKYKGLWINYYAANLGLEVARRVLEANFGNDVVQWVMAPETWRAVRRRMNAN